MTHHLGKLATNYVSKALKSDLRFSFLPESGIKKGTGGQLCPLPTTPPPHPQSDVLLAAEFLSFLLRFLAREERQQEEQRQKERSPATFRSPFMPKDLQNLPHGTWGES